ncbi:MAG: 3-alpha,7-alpha,12-alpha-trihydroxy-5-beta-cholest-24-enoyl-CoA hydratase [Rhodospirillaceae bacterium]|nr:3-alpha,7-alpha,12-alpha-trihydroxy-5-beta-cholest-24-enoyl-CoA hydratase [Rhodospirillaceae bacterium]
MAITQESLLAIEILGKEFTYTDNDSMLYALGIGMGADQMDRQELSFCYEQGQRVMPSQATVIAFDVSTFWNCGIDIVQMVHGEQRLNLHQPLPPAATVVSDVRVINAFDKGEGRGALIQLETVLTDKASGDKLCTMESVLFARGDGGYGGPQGSPEALPKSPMRPADHVVEFQTLPRQALIYRLSGDRNPLHCDPDFAATGGFEKPILHGLCTYGHACHAVLRAACDYEPERMLSFSARFSAPVIPGDLLQTHIWEDEDEIYFTTSVPERDLIVLSNGFATIAV